MSVTKHTILLVDDHPMMRCGLRQRLELESDLEVVGEAASGQEALALWTQVRPQLILLDNKMAGISGLETLRRLRKAGCKAKILVFTVSDAEEDVQVAMRDGADGYLLKDMEPEDLIVQLRCALQGEVVISPRMAAMLQHSVALAPAQGGHELTPRETEVLRMMVTGKSNKGIAAQLGIADATVKVHVKNLLAKLNLRSRVEAVIWAMERLRN
jgi:two-component system nitrate/nitrite response regulator NarL